MTFDANDDLLRWRSEFPILENTTYLISNSLGAMPRTVYERLRDYADSWATLGVRAWGAGWWDLKGAVGDKIALLMGAPAGSVLIHENASIANSILLSGMDFSDLRRDQVVTTDQDFPSDVYSLRAMLPDHMQIRVVHSRDGIGIETDDLLNAITERTRLVSISHVLFRSAYVVDVQAVVEKAHRAGAQVLLNGYHSVGIIPLDVTALDVDFYIGGTLKWLCGGPGGVFLYVRPDLLTTLKPKITGWFAHQQPFAFDIEHFALREDAYRLANGTPGIASLYAIQPGVEIITQVGVTAIREKSLRQTALLIELADHAGYEVRSPRDPDHRAGTVTISMPNAYAVSRALIAEQFIVDYREGAGIRIAPHFYNSDDELRRTFEAMERIIAEGSWQPYAAGRSFVT
jgi:kynureninase